MSKKTFKVPFLAMVFGILLLAGAQSAMAQSAFTVSTTVKEPINSVATTCDLGEAVTFTGTLDSVYEVINDGAGSLKLHIHSNWQNVIGSTASGLQYRGTNESDQTLDLASLPWEDTITVSEQWVGKGDGARNLVYTLSFVVKVAADGSVVTTKDKESITCEQ